MKKLLLAAELPQEEVLRLKQVFDIFQMPSNSSVLELLKGANGANAVIIDQHIKLEAPVIEILAPTCNIISVCGNDSKNIDVITAAKKGITVCFSDRPLTDAIADMIFALLFATGRKVIKGNEYVRLGRDRGYCPQSLLGTDVSLSTLGLIGGGAVSRALSTRAKAFNMKLLYASENEDNVLNSLGAKKVSLEDLLAFSDYISLNSEYVLTKDKFNLTKKGSIILSAVDENLLDEKALMNALENEDISAAALDVYTKQNLLELKKHENCILTPKMGSATEKKRNMLINDAIKNVMDYYDGKEVNAAIK